MSDFFCPMADSKGGGGALLALAVFFSASGHFPYNIMGICDKRRRGWYIVFCPFYQSFCIRHWSVPPRITFFRRLCCRLACMSIRTAHVHLTVVAARCLWYHCFYVLQSIVDCCCPTPGCVQYWCRYDVITRNIFNTLWCYFVGVFVEYKLLICVTCKGWILLHLYHRTVYMLQCVFPFASLIYV